MSSLARDSTPQRAPDVAPSPPPGGAFYSAGMGLQPCPPFLRQRGRTLQHMSDERQREDAQEQPVERVSENEIRRKRTWAAAIELCAEIGGFALDKQARDVAGMDQARWSRIKSGKEGIKWDQLREFMDGCGNHAPVLWMAYQLGYDLDTMKFRENEYEREIRELREKLDRSELEKSVLARALRGEE